MPNLEKILREQFGFQDDHFDENGRVRVNSLDGTISSMPVPPARPDCIVLKISDVLKIGHEITVRVADSHCQRQSLRILDINADGLAAINANGVAGFLPWEILSFGISHPRHLDITPFAGAEDAPQSTLRATNAHMELRLAREKAAVNITEEVLAAIGRQMRPSVRTELAAS